MKLKITYLDVNITQILSIVDQMDYDNYKKAKALDSDNKAWNALNDSDREFYKKVLIDFAWTTSLFKAGKGCTTDSPIYKSLTTGEVRLPITQGGVIKVKAVLI